MTGLILAVTFAGVVAAAYVPRPQLIPVLSRRKTR